MHLLHPVFMPISTSCHLCKAPLDKIHVLAVHLLQREREADLHKLARALLEHETLDAEDIKAVLSGTFSRVPVGGQEAAGDLRLAFIMWVHLGSAWKKSTGLLTPGGKLDDRSETVHRCHSTLQ